MFGNGRGVIENNNIHSKLAVCKKGNRIYIYVYIYISSLHNVSRFFRNDHQANVFSYLLNLVNFMEFLYICICICICICVYV